jgi:hypothetical protein
MAPHPSYSRVDCFSGKESEAVKNIKRSTNLTDDGLYDYGLGPIGKYLGLPKYQIGGQTKDGVHYMEKDLIVWIARCGWATTTEQAFMNVIEELETNYKAAESLWDKYKGKLHEFRSAVKNDCTSLEAAARKTTDATMKLNKAYGDVILQMNGPDMARAIENAERLAAAMTALANLQSHRLVLSVSEQTPEPK